MLFLAPVLKVPKYAHGREVFYLGHYQSTLFISVDSHCVHLTPHNLSNMSLRFQIWLSVTELATITLLGISIIVYGVAVLCMPDTGTAGLLTIVVSVSISSTTLTALTFTV